MQANWRSRLVAYLVHGRQLKAIRTWLRDCDSLIDVGCGSNSPLQYMSFAGEMIGIDGFFPAIASSKAKGIHNRYVHCNLQELTLPAKCADATIALEVLEHFSKETGLEFLKRLEHLAVKIVILSTPNGYVEQGIIDGNEYQRHLSGWTPSELQALGFNVYGILGLKGLRGPYAAINRKPYVFWALVSRLSEPFVWRYPELAFGLLCYKTIGE